MQFLSQSNILDLHRRIIVIYMYNIHLFSSYLVMVNFVNFKSVQRI